MQVADPNDRQTAPEECDGCGYLTELQRFVSYGPGRQVDWLCRFCANSQVDKNLSSLFNELLRAIKECR